jgi:hypothetical protein
MKEALSSSETSVLTRATWRNIPEDDILHSHCHENLKSYMFSDGWCYPYSVSGAEAALKSFWMNAILITEAGTVRCWRLT